MTELAVIKDCLPGLEVEQLQYVIEYAEELIADKGANVSKLSYDRLLVRLRSQHPSQVFLNWSALKPVQQKKFTKAWLKALKWICKDFEIDNQKAEHLLICMVTFTNLQPYKTLATIIELLANVESMVSEQLPTYGKEAKRMLAQLILDQ